MHARLLGGFALACLASAVIAAQQPAGGLKIVVIAGEGAVNIIQQKSAVAPIVEVRDRNNLPVAGATVTFSIGGGSGATFGGGSTLTVVTNAAGQATAAGLTPTAAGAIQVNVTAAFQGQLATAAVTQTNFATAQAAAAASSGAAGGGGGGASGAGAGAGAAGGGGGLSATTIAIIGGAAAAGGVGAAYATGAIGTADGGIVLKGTVYATGLFGTQASTCPSGVFETTGGSSSTCYMNPVSGAVVSTTLDSNTATTDTAGNFDLETTVPWSEIESCPTYTLTIAAAGHPTYVITTGGFSGNKSGASSVHRQKFILSPMTPSFMGGC